GTGGVVQNVGLIGGSITGAANVGSLVGWNAGTVSSSYSTATVVGTNIQVGDLVGTNQGTLTGSHAGGNVTPQGYTSHPVGWNNTGSITNSYATGNVSVSLASGQRAGGLVVYNFAQASISHSYATGNVTGTASSVGGLVGEYDTNGQTNTSIIDTYATGSV